MELNFIFRLRSQRGGGVRLAWRESGCLLPAPREALFVLASGFSFTPGSARAGRVACMLQVRTRGHGEAIGSPDVPTVQTQLGEFNPFSTVSSQPTSTFLNTSLNVCQGCVALPSSPPATALAWSYGIIFYSLSFGLNIFKHTEKRKEF